MCRKALHLPFGEDDATEDEARTERAYGRQLFAKKEPPADERHEDAAGKAAFHVAVCRGDHDLRARFGEGRGGGHCGVLALGHGHGVGLRRLRQLLPVRHRVEGRRRLVEDQTSPFADPEDRQIEAAGLGDHFIVGKLQIVGQEEGSLPGGVGRAKERAAQTAAAAVFVRGRKSVKRAGGKEARAGEIEPSAAAAIRELGVQSQAVVIGAECDHGFRTLSQQFGDPVRRGGNRRRIRHKSFHAFTSVRIPAQKNGYTKAEVYAMAIVFIRTLIIYLALLLTMRLLGKRQLGEMELSEFVVASLIADLAAHPLQDVGIPMTNGLVPILTLFCFEILIAGVSMKSVRLRTLLFGRPSVLVRRGVIDQREMRLNRFLRWSSNTERCWPKDVC